MIYPYRGLLQLAKTDPASSSPQKAQWPEAESIAPLWLPYRPTYASTVPEIPLLAELRFHAGYSTGAESNCTTGLCCRSNNHNNLSPHKVLEPAPRYDAYLWSDLHSIQLRICPLTGFQWHPYILGNGRSRGHSSPYWYPGERLCLHVIHRRSCLSRSWQSTRKVSALLDSLNGESLIWQR